MTESTLTVSETNFEAMESRFLSLIDSKATFDYVELFNFTANF